MSNSFNCTSGAHVVGASSLLNTLIPTSAQPSAQTVVLPYVGNLASGQYASEIVAVVDAVQNGAIVGIDCTHKLTDNDGNIIWVKFRYFAPSDIEALAKVLGEYGLTGNLGSALMGLQETVSIAPRPGSSRYMYISHRDKLSNTPTSTVSPPTTQTSSSPKNNLGSRLGGRSQTPSAQRQALLLLDDEEDDDFDFNLDE